MLVRELVDLLNKANQAYYNSDSPLMSNLEYDLKIKELQELEQKLKIIYSDSPTQTVGASVLPELKKVQITPKPMLSLDKCHSDEEVAAFAGKHTMIAMVKLDGLSVRVKYNNGKLMSANTRGNGVEGTDITEHIKQFQNVPLEIPYQKELVVDGEAIIKIPNFEEINKNNEFKNPRNAAAGALNVLDTQLVKDRKLSFIAWDVIVGSNHKLLSEKLVEIQSYGFEIVYFITDTPADEIKSANNIIMSFKDEYPCDGVVWKFNDTEYGNSLGQTSHHFKNGIAWKPEVEVVESTLKYIDWTMGRTGILTPVAVFEPIELDGSTIERASLHNLSVMKSTLKVLKQGLKVKVYKANLIIPQILSAEPADLDKPIEIPEICPICGAPTAIITSSDGVENLICSNPNCSGKLINHLDHFCGKKGLDIRGLSKATLGKLIDWDWVKEFHDIFELKYHRDEWALKPGFGVKSVNNILETIENIRTSDIPLEKYISAIGIPLIGLSQAKELAKYFKDFPSFVHATEEESNFDFYTIDGFGPERVGSILNFDYGEAILAGAALAKWPASVKKEDNLDNLKDIVVVITGSLKQYKNRTALQSEIESRGGRVSSTVSAKTSYLINNDNTSTSSKNLTAKKLGVPIISEEEFIQKFLQ